MQEAVPRRSHWRFSPTILDGQTQRERCTSCSSLRRFPGIHEKHWSITGTDIAAVFEKLCRDRPWLDRLAVFEDGPIVQIVDKYAERPGKFGPSFGDPPARRIRDEPRACADSGGQQRDDALPRSGKRGAATRDSRGAIARPRQEIHDYLRVCVHGRKRCGNETRHDCSERCAAVGYARQLRGVASDHEMPTERIDWKRLRTMPQSPAMSPCSGV
jgi:hypothetical protein